MVLRDPVAASGASSSDADDPVAEGDEVYTPPTDPVVTTDLHGEAEVLGGFGTEEDATARPEPSALDGRPGDEAIADAIRRELREDAATTALGIEVEVWGGVVHLRGVVAGPEDVEAAEAVAARVPGVVEVADELELRLAAQPRREPDGG